MRLFSSSRDLAAPRRERRAGWILADRRAISTQEFGRAVKRRRFSVGRETHPATVIPAGSNRSGDGGNEVVKAFDGKDR